ncbi:MAG: tyrosine protein kinase, partial [Lachnospiraceae bacterium]|nr:tyrosine protein kinase [Lachnospiraceae bacterium]
DGIIFLTAQASISYKFAQKQIEQLKKSGCRILGAILNKVENEGKGGYYGRGYKKGGDYSYY